MELLFTLPLPARTIFLADLAKEVVSNPASWVIPVPFMWVVLFCAGYGWVASIALALASGAFLVTLAETVRLPVEVYLRQRLRPDRLRNLLAAAGIVSMVMLIGLVTMATGGLGIDSLVRLARVLPPEVAALPWALPLALCRRSVPVPVTLAAMVAILALTVYAAGVLAERAVRRGLIAQGTGLTGRRREARQGRGGLPLRGVAGKELLLLARDRNYLVRTLILPVGLALFQVAINPGMFYQAQRNLAHASALAFGLSAYMLLMSGTRLIIHEGQGLWLLYTFPRTLDRILLGKAVLWSAAATTLAAALLIVVGARSAPGPWPLAEAVVTALGGVLLFGMISSAVGALACDPQETRQNKQVPPAAIYLLMLIAGLYASCFYIPSLYVKAVTMTIFALVAVAFWQKARARLPYLLDPVSRPPPSLDVADALIAAFAFFAVQGVATVVLMAAQIAMGQAVTLGYSLAAVAVGLLSMLILAARRIPHFLEQVGLAWPKGGLLALARSLGVGLGLGVAAAGVAAGYLWIVAHIPALRPWMEIPTLWSQLRGSDRLWLLLLAVVAAPICEEYLFRGLLLRSLERHSGPIRAAVFSALVFALMHPPIAFLPVFVLGIAAAASFRRGTTLLAPILAHTVYNALLVLAPMLTR
jgi:membrane protease YdiL (CAAX protease family)